MPAIKSDIHIVPAVFPIDLSGGAQAGDFVSMKNYGHCDVVIMIGPTAGATCAVTLDKATAVAGGTTELEFTTYYSTGFRLDYDGASGPFTVGETVTGGGGGTGVVVYDNGDHLICHTFNGTTFVDDETITGGTSLNTASANGIQKNEDILVPRTASSNTFTIPATANRTYVIPIDDTMLGDGYDCLQVDLADAGSSQTDGVAFYVMSQPRYAGEIAETAIYD
jgi:hypothetical protein